jgi:hypothetical protein
MPRKYAPGMSLRTWRQACISHRGIPMTLRLIAAALVAVALLAFLSADITVPTAVLAMAMVPAANVKAMLHSVADVMAALSCSRSTVYVLINTGQLDAVKVLTATRITDESLQRLLAFAPRAQIAGNVEAPQPRKRASRAAA